MSAGSGFPNPVDWVADQVGGLVGGVASAGFDAIVGGLVSWVVEAVVWVVGGVFNFFLDAGDPNVQADWFVTGTGPFATTLRIGAGLLLLFVFAGIIQGTLAGDTGGMLRRIAVDLPASVLGMVAIVTVTQALIRLTDELSGHVMGNFGEDITAFGTVVASLQALTGGTVGGFVVFVLGIVTVLAGLVVVAELTIRAALIYIVVALAPIIFATRLWPVTRGGARRLLELLCALILSKLVIAVALSVAAAAAVGAGSGGEVTALPPPETFAEDTGGSITQAVGILLAAAAAFGVAAFSPLLIAKLLPLTEAALVAQGIKGAPVRAGHQGLMMANTAQMVSGHRLHQLATARTTPAGTPGPPHAAGGVGAAGPAAVAGAAGAAATAASAGSAATRAAAGRAAASVDAATDRTSQADRGATGRPRNDPTRPRPPSAGGAGTARRGWPSEEEGPDGR